MKILIEELDFNEFSILLQIAITKEISLYDLGILVVGLFSKFLTLSSEKTIMYNSKWGFPLPVCSRNTLGTCEESQEYG